MAAHRYALVQHSGFARAGNPQFEAGLESVPVNTHEEKRVLALGGVTGTYGEIEDLAMRLMYPDDQSGLIPNFRGTFAAQCIDGLPIAIPVREIVP